MAAPLATRPHISSRDGKGPNPRSKSKRNNLGKTGARTLHFEIQFEK